MELSSRTAVHSPERTLVIMAKAPKSGMVKTRLAQDLPLSAVTELYRCLLNDTIALACSLQNVEVAIVCPAADVSDLEQIAGNAARVVAQDGEGLAAGLTSVFAHFTVGDRRVIAFNSDSPHLPASVLQNAFAILSAHDVVVGPTHDGGYYLVGARAAHPGLFSGEGMGTGSALDSLLAHARERQLSVELTEPFFDVDVQADLSRLADELSSAPERAPRTAAWLDEWRRSPDERRSSLSGAL